MDIPAILKFLEASWLATTIRESLLLFPLIESIHVFGLALIFGTITIVDLRLLGVASAHRPFSRIASDILKWTWTAFAITVLTGALMFITNAPVYYHNSYFRAKMLLLALSGINMLAFELTTGRRVHRWDTASPTPRSARLAAALSLTMWIAIIFLGRLVGFTTTRAAVVAPPPASVDFGDFLQGPPPKP